ncbi:MAG: TrkA family potassium uptake protein [Anaerolineae bacterium]|nr:TrkA family potassium uptake protein [Anaerolineae bacterium]
MKVIIVGCGRVGAELAYNLYKKGHEVAVLDSVGAAFSNLPPDFSGRSLEGDVLNHDMLHRAGIESADALAAVTSSDALNAVVGHVAREVYHIPHVVVRNFNPHTRRLYEVFGLQVVSSTSWGAQRIEEMICHEEVRTVFSAGNGEVEIYEIVIPSECSGRRLSELLQNKECIAVALTRGGRSQLPREDALLEDGDVLHISATFDGIEDVRRRLCEMGKVA